MRLDRAAALLSFRTRVATTATVSAPTAATIAVATSAAATRTITAFAGTTTAILRITWASTLATAGAIATATTAIAAAGLSISIRTGFLGFPRRTAEEALQPAEKSAGLFDGLSSRCAIARTTLSTFARSTRSAWLTGFTQATRFTCAWAPPFAVFIALLVAFRPKRRPIVVASGRFGITF